MKINYPNLTRKVKYISILIVVVVVSNILLDNIQYNNFNLVIFISLVSIVLSIIFFMMYTKRTMLLFLLFLSSFIIFQFGEPIIYLLDKSFNFRMFYYTTELEVFKSLKYTLNSIFLLLVGGVFFYKFKITGSKKKKYVDFNNSNLIKNSIVIFSFTYVFSTLLILVKLYIVIKHGYLPMEAFEENLPFFIKIFDFLLIPISILSIFISKRNRSKIFYLMIIWSILISLTGQRTAGISSMLTFLILKFTVVNNSKVELKKLVISGFILSILILVFITSIVYFRTPDYRENFSLSFRYVYEGIFEMGFSFNTLSMTKMLIFQGASLRNGETYLFSILSMFPSSLDFTGIISSFNEKALLAEWLTENVGLDFGAGFSLIAESYLNFGENGFLVFFLIGAIMINLLEYNRDDVYLFKNYSSIVFLYLSFTSPRREFFYIANAFMYSYIVFPLFYYFLKKIKIKW